MDAQHVVLPFRRRRGLGSLPNPGCLSRATAPMVD